MSHVNGWQSLGRFHHLSVHAVICSSHVIIHQQQNENAWLDQRTIWPKYVMYLVVAYLFPICKQYVNNQCRCSSCFDYYFSLIAKWQTVCMICAFTKTRAILTKNCKSFHYFSCTCGWWHMDFLLLFDSVLRKPKNSHRSFTSIIYMEEW